MSETNTDLSSRSVEERVKILDKLKAGYPGKILLCFKKSAQGNSSTPNLPPAIMVNHSSTWGSILASLRSTYKLKPEEALFFLCNNQQITGSILISQLAAEHLKHEGDFLTIVYAAESTFG